MRLVRNILILLVFSYAAVYAEPARMLTWVRVDGAAGYYLEIKDSGNIVVVAQIINDNSYDVLQLEPGKYSFRIATVNVLNQKGVSTGWIDFTVEKLFIPKLNTVSRKELIASAVNKNIIIRGSNFKDQSRFILRGNGVEIALKNVDLRSENEAIVSFKPSSAQKGKYDLVVINRGGVESVLKNTITIVEAKNAKTYFCIGGAYSVNIPMGGFPDYVTMSYIGASAFLQISALKLGFENIRFDFEMDAARYENTDDSKKFSLTNLTFGFGLDYVYPFSSGTFELIFKLLTGPDYTMLTLDESLTDKNQNSINWFATIGAGLRYYPGRNFFIEPSFAWKTVFYADTLFHNARASLGCGIRF